MFRLFFTMATAVFIPLHLYVGYRLWQSLHYYFPPLKKAYFWPVFTLLSSSFFIGRFIGGAMPAALLDLISAFGYFWMIAMLYLLFFFVPLDFYEKLRGSAFSPQAGNKARLVAVLLVIALLLYGSWNARYLRVARYDISIEKYAGELKQIKAVMISDLHLGDNIGNKRLKSIVDRIGELDPDLVVIAGDIIQDSEQFTREKMFLQFQKLQPPLGVYASLGNHEFYGGTVKDTVSLLELGGIKVLRDSVVKIEDSFYLVGKDDPAAGRGSSYRNSSLKELTENLDKNLPVILIYHQPAELKTALEAGVDLQFSGHTHAGQVFPANVITSLLFAEDWGYLRQDTLQLIVSCGIGTWGPDLRIGSYAEIVEAVISFRTEENKQ